MRTRKLLVVLFALTMLFTGITAGRNEVQASENAIVVTDDANMVIIPGETTHVKIPIKAVTLSIINPTIKVEAATDAPFTIGMPSMSLSGTTTLSLPNVDGAYLEFDVTTKATAAINDYPVTFTFAYYDYTADENKTTTFKTVLEVRNEKAPAQLTASSVVMSDATIGADTNFSFTVKNEGGLLAKSVYVKINFGDSIVERYTTKNISVGDLAMGGSQLITLPVSILDSATTGRKTLSADFTYKTEYGTTITSSYSIYVNLKEDKTRPLISIDKVSLKDGLKAGEDFTLGLTLINEGAELAKNIDVSIDAASLTKDGVLKNYYTDGISVNDIKSNKKQVAKIPLTVSKYTTSGLKELKVNITYTNQAGVAYTHSDTVYVDVVSENTSANLVISGVQQSPAQPSAGERMEVSFYLENKGQVDVEKLKVAAQDLTEATFIPVEAEPYQYFEKLAAGAKTKITIPLTVSDSIAEGLNNLVIKYTYSGGEGTATIPIRDIQNELGSKSKPKLIVSKYITDTDQLRAGSTFNFTFDIYNTHSSMAAKNITVTLTQADNVFTPTQGSNSFFINKIAAGETAQNTIELKVKSDATTKAYPLKITIEYEYDGIEPNPETGEVGLTKVEELNLQAVENARPVVDNVSVYSWDGSVMAGGTATLAFEFYNMGKSVLNNVIATVEGDFAKADGTMYFVGNVEAGNSSYVEFDVIPNMEGMAQGVLKVTYEDSNGDQIEFTKEFESQVMPASGIDTGVIGDGSQEVLNPDMMQTKKAIVPIWLFIIIQIVIFAAFVPITRKIIINVYKSKLRKKEQEQY